LSGDRVEGYNRDMADYSFVSENLSEVRDRIQAAAKRAGRNPSEIGLLAVTKFHPVEAALAAYSSGVRRFGENRVQEAASKYPPEARSLMPGAEVDLIGTLQGNKVNKALGIFDSIQSVDSLSLLGAIAARIRERDRPLKLYLELHTGEASKAGFSSVDEILKAIDSYHEIFDGSRAAPRGTEDGGKPPPPVELAGLMTMAPFTEDEALVRSSFGALREAFEEVRRHFSPPGFRELSMGMSGDFEIAIEEGSTLLRIGTAIFGARQ